LNLLKVENYLCILPSIIASETYLRLGIGFPMNNMNKDKGNLLCGLNLANGPSHAPILGELELDVMESLWRQDSLTAQQVLDGMQDRGIGLSTIQSTLERLVRKQLLSRTKSGRAFVYSPIIAREELIGLMIQQLASRLAHDRITPMVSGFCAYVEKRRSKKKAQALAVILRKFITGKTDN
jgi:predicted transcriptional regulator